MNEARYPLGIQSFPKLRTQNKIYVDKTALVHRLVTTSQYYFLSRPRRFGKSLLVSTLEEYFLGHKELFEGLAIYDLQPGDWPEHPVLHFDLSKKSYLKSGDLEDALNHILEPYEAIYGCDEKEKSPDLRFDGLINRAYAKTGREVVVLIDEYDLPIINCFGNKALEEENRAILKGFYGIMKSQDAKLRFVFLTGVGKIGHLSVFSGLNNLRDISIERTYSTICGITEEELHRNFDEGVGALAENNGWSKDEAYARLKRQYDGYHFAENMVDVYNPFSLINCLVKLKISDFWFQTGTPTHLLNVLKASDMDLATLDGSSIDENSLAGADVIQTKPLPYMFYTGYLTFKAYDREFNEFILGYPNQEVMNGFVKCLLPIVTSGQEELADTLIKSGVRMLRAGRIEDFLETMKAFFAKIPYNPNAKNEYFYQNIMYCVATLIGAYAQAEYHTSQGRIDMVLATDTTVYVMEFKLDGTAEKAMRQIDDRNYALPFAADGRRIVKVGANFSSATHTLDSWTIG